jgi:SdrD B-like domain/Pilus formation protein N terminal region
LGYAASSAVEFVLHKFIPLSLQQDGVTQTQESRPSRNYVPRIKLTTGETRELNFGEAITAATVLDESVASAAITGERQVALRGIGVGETVLILSGKSMRSTYVLQVMRPVLRRPRRSSLNDVNRPDVKSEPFSGFYTIYFSPGSDGAPSLTRHSFEFNQKLSGGRTLRASGEMFDFFGKGERALIAPYESGFGVNRLGLGIDSASGSLDLLDSELNVSDLTFSNYTLRGPHFVSKAAFGLPGLEVFAGRARPRNSFFSHGEGTLAGALVPVVQGRRLQVRAGFFFITPERSKAESRAAILQMGARYAPDESTTAEAEALYSKGQLSWRARLDLRRGPFNGYAELFRLDPRSALVGLGAQSAGRRANLFSLQWRPSSRFAASLSYNVSTRSTPAPANAIELSTRAFKANVGYNLTRGSRLSFSLNQQEIETPTTLALPYLDLRTRSITVRYGQRINRQWSNDLEARFISSRENSTDSAVKSSLDLREQLRYSWGRKSLVGFINYRSNTPSLADLILRNPSLLPDELRAAFAADPARFLLTNRESLPQLLPNVELPLTRSTEAGLRFQAAFSRLNIAAETRYSLGEIFARDERRLLASFTTSFKLDAANSIEFNGTRTLAFDGTKSQKALTVSLTHRFGAGSGGGFQLSSLLGLTRGRIQGRAFFDLNGNGLDDAGEPGVAGAKVQLDDNHTATTDAMGRFSFNAIGTGAHKVAYIAADSGINWRATNNMLQQIFLSPRETVQVSFGVTNFGFLEGRVFNDISLTSEMSAGEAPGLGGIHLTLRPLSAGPLMREPLSQTVGLDGRYEFRNLPPGSYMLEIDPSSTPTDFRPPVKTSWPVTISPLQGFYLDIPFAAQRAVSGILFIDRDDNGQFDPERDEAIGGARVFAGAIEAQTNNRGSYILRNLPAGIMELRATLPDGRTIRGTTLELGPNPIYKGGVNLIVREK